MEHPTVVHSHSKARTVVCVPQISQSGWLDDRIHNSVIWNRSNLHEEYQVTRRSKSEHDRTGKAKDKRISPRHNTQTCLIFPDQTPFKKHAHARTHTHLLINTPAWIRSHHSFTVSLPKQSSFCLFECFQRL